MRAPPGVQGAFHLPHARAELLPAAVAQEEHENVGGNAAAALGSGNPSLQNGAVRAEHLIPAGKAQLIVDGFELDHVTHEQGVAFLPVLQQPGAILAEFFQIGQAGQGVAVELGFNAPLAAGFDG